jgi:16S rRNA (cytosine1402-N4)-methyltransferase
MDAAERHVPVMLERVVALLAPALAHPGAVLVDATLGLGGHSEAFLRQFPEARLVGLDRDPEALRLAGERLTPYEERTTFVHAVYDELPRVLAELDIPEIDGILFDLGVSSMQLDEAERGFAYAQDAPLDMRMDQTRGMTAAQVLNTYEAGQLVRVLRVYGEEKFASRIVSAILKERAKAPLTSSARLAELVRDAIPAAARRTGGHPAKRTFQALRIEVNQEIRALEALLAAAPEVLNPGGRIVVISYHSLEDRLVKRVFAGHAGRGRTLPGLGAAPATGRMELLTPNAVLPAEAEVERNPRASSARLRAARLRRRPLSEGTA